MMRYASPSDYAAFVMGRARPFAAQAVMALIVASVAFGPRDLCRDDAIAVFRQ